MDWPGKSTALHQPGCDSHTRDCPSSKVRRKREGEGGREGEREGERERGGGGGEKEREREREGGGGREIHLESDIKQ